METAQRERVGAFAHFVNGYKTAAILLLNTIVLFVLINVVAWVFITCHRLVTGPPLDPVSLKYPESDLRTIYPAMTDQQRKQLLLETYSRSLHFEQFSQLREREINGTYVNVSPNGYRSTSAQGPWPIDAGNYNVFVFGGSTTFGYGVADDQTIPAYLQELLSKSGSGTRRVAVYNFGTAFLYSTPERILFEQLLQGGAKPDLVIFIDGINDFIWTDDSAYWLTPAIQKTIEPSSEMAQLCRSVAGIYRVLPIERCVYYIQRRLNPGRQSDGMPSGDKSALLPGVIHRYVWNKRAIEQVAAAYGIPAVFVFQPSSTYEYDLHFHLFKGDDWATTLCNVINGYPLMAQYVKSHSMGDDFLWLADIQNGIQKPLYCDQIHYTSDFNKQIAGEIQNSLQTRHLLH